MGWMGVFTQAGNPYQMWTGTQFSAIFLEGESKTPYTAKIWAGQLKAMRKRGNPACAQL